MAKASRYLAGKYLTVEAVQGMTVAERTVTISHVAEESIQGTDKLVAYFDGQEAGLPLNNTRIEQLLELHGGEDETDKWRGTKVEIYVDPHVRMGGKKVGGVGLRAAAATAA